MKPHCLYFRLALIMSIMALFSRSAYAYEFSQSDWSLSYNNCEGYIQIEIMYYSDHDGAATFADWMELLDVYYLNGGVQTKILTWKDDDHDCSVCDQSHTFDGVTWNYKLLFNQYNSWASVSVPNTDDEQKKMIIKLYTFPNTFFGTSATIRIDGLWFGGGAGDDDVPFDNWDKTVDIPGIGAPSGLSATVDANCNNVQLAWTNPQSNPCPSGDWEILVYRDNSLIASAEKATSFTDATAVKGVSYNYKLRALLTPNAHTADFSDYTSEVLGRRLGALPPPTNISASSDRCDGKIQLQWVWTNQTTPTSYIIERKLASGSTFVNIDTIGGDKLQYIDSMATGDIAYDYRIQSINICGDLSTFSDTTNPSGYAAAVPAAPTNVTATEGMALINVSWTDNSSTETGFLIERTYPGAGSPLIIEVAPNTTTYADNSVANCVTYTYIVKAKSDCYPNGNGSAQASLLIHQDISNTFPDGSFDASKGYDPDKVVLQWSNNNGNLINAIKIYRRILESGDNYALLFTLNSGSGIYNDIYAEAGVLYEYLIFAESQCENSTIYSDSTTSIGFRRKVGTVTGQVTYSGGTAVEGVKISAESTTGFSGRSLQTGAGSAELVIPDAPDLDFDTTFLVEMWIRPYSYTTSYRVIEKANVFNIEHITGVNQFRVTVYKTPTVYVQETIPESALPISNFSHLAVQIHNEHLQIYVNGVLLKDKPLTPTFPNGVHLNVTNTSINIGRFFPGLIDEVRIWNKSKTAQEIQRDYSRLMIGTELNLKAYLNFNEGVGKYAYDASKTGTIYNKHHGELIGGATFNTIIPTSSQLSASSYTNATGNYTLVIPYNGAGEVFELTPSFTIHEFDPSVTALFIGDGAPIHNNVNFLDKSSFRVTGSVNFKNTTCGVPNAFLKVDGVILVVEGVPAKTDATGAFDIQVPIGMHHLEVEQGGHVYEVGRFPATGKYDFQADLAGVNFVDSTLVRVVGRVVGGLREGSKVPGLGKSKNNIGVAHITLTSQQGNGCSIVNINTDPLTGEFSVKLPPLKYVPAVSITSNASINFGSLDLVDLSGTPILMTKYDTLFDVDGAYVSRDSVKFHRQLDYIYRVNPVIAVFDRDGVSPFIGDTTYTYFDPNTNAEATRNLRTDPFRWPVFTEKDGGSYIYRCMIRVFEPYKNFDAAQVVTDSVPTTDGTLQVINDFADITSASLKMKDYNTLDTLKSIVYSFHVGKPSFIENSSIPEYSFTQKLEINLITSAGNAIPWLPVPPSQIPAGGNAIYRAYLLGTQTAGQEFVTFGPDVPEYVLRDPPGSNSTASREIGSSKTEKSSWNWTLGGALHTKDDIYIGAEFNVGLGVSTATRVKNNTTVGFKAEIGGGNSGEQSITTTNTKEWSTNDAFSIAPGTPSDVYIGTSRNLQYGIAEELAIIPQDQCSDVQCIGGNGTQPASDFTFGKRYGLAIVPGGYETQFQFTEYAIKNNILPDLYNLRNVILQTNPKYVSHLPIDDENYGRNNDDPVFGANVSSTTPDAGDYEDLSGPSYTYNAVDLVDSLGGDSVRVINIQIDKWIDAITLNEWEKVNINNEEAIDSLRELELDALDDEYFDSEYAYASLVLANGIGGIVVAYGLIATPGPGSAIGGFATFAVTAATGIALAELTTAHEEYLHKKQLINDKFDQLGTSANYTLSGGTSFSSSMTQQSATSYTQSFEYALTADLLIEIEGKVNGAGVGLEKGLELKHTIGRDWSTDNDSTEVVAFTLSDSDVGDLYSVDVFPSLLGWGPIFKNRAGGATSCPHEDEVATEYYEPGTVVSERTLQIEVPTISISQSILTNIPSDEAAVFNLTLGNASENGYTNEYNLSIIAASNPFGAIVRFDGLPSQSVIIPGSVSVNKVMTINKGPGPVYDYDSIMVIFTSPCQYTGGSGFNTDIGDTVYISAHFLPSCTDVSLASPEDKWVLNNSFHDTMPVAIIDYNINYDALENIRYEYKPQSSSNWIGLQTFLKDPVGVGDVPIPTSTPFILYDWDVAQLTDGLYDVRVSSTCANNVQNFSTTHSGVIDRINPHPFGNPSPADGILSPNDEMSIRFNEPIDLGSINQVFNFDIRGVINGTETDHSTSLYFDGLNDYLIVPGGLPIQNRDFTLEFSAKRMRTGEECLFSQGTDVNERFYVGFNGANKFVIRINGTEIASNDAITDQNWHYFAVSYDYEGETVQLYVAGETTTAFVANNGNTSIFAHFTALSELEIGRNSSLESNYFQGNINEVRVWTTARSLNQFSASKSILISGAENGILYNWRIDEADGSIAGEHIRKRDADIIGATWQITPNGNAASFDGLNDVVTMESNDVNITPGMDFTLEFWFNSTSVNASTLWSNGSGSNLSADSLISWKITKDASGLIHVVHYGMDFIATSQDYFDGSWHHFALVFQRAGNLSAYVDGQLENSTQAVPYKQLGGSHMYLGATGIHENNTENISQYYTGKIDEFRFWNTARKLSQIRRDKQHRMNGDELGLKVYLPFEHYSTDPTGIPILTASFNDQVENPHVVNAVNGVSLINQTPTIKLQRPVQQIAFTYSVNNDQIIFTTTTSPEIIENVTLDITVEGIKDLHGNVMESPATWIAYMDKNQVVWQDDQLQFSFTRGGEHLKFTSAVINQGGAAKAFHIENIPVWLTVTPSSGTVNPNSSVQVTFEVDDNINLGDYTQDIQLLTDFNFPERLTLLLKVRDQAPEWTFDPSGFESNMSIVGRLKLNGVISTDDEDMIIAMIGQDIRGIGQLEYIPELDAHLVFLDVFSNATVSVPMTFRIWDASSGLIFPDVLPTNLQYQPNAILGTTNVPITFESSNTVSFEVPVVNGWTWLGFPLAVPVPTDINAILVSLTHTAGDEIKNLVDYCNYNGNSNQFVGTLDDSGKGIKPEQMYKMKNQVNDILIMKGTVINPTTKIISLVNGWNYIGFISIRNQSLEQALGNLTPHAGDIIKGKTNFAIYDAAAGWIGSLNTLIPGAGYMYKSNGTNTFTYPLAGMFNNFNLPDENVETRSLTWKVDSSPYSSNMTLTGIVESACPDLTNDGNVFLGIMDPSGRLREMSKIIRPEESDRMYLTIAGDAPEMLDVYLLDGNSHRAYKTNQQIDFAANVHMGDPENPWLLTISADVCLALDENMVSAASDQLVVYPTPFREAFTVEYASVTDYAEGWITLTDAAGRIVQAMQIEVRSGKNVYPINIAQANMSAGIYVMELHTPTEKMVARIVKSN